MSAITVTDLEYDRELDHKAMASIGGGGGAPWIYGWITPYLVAAAAAVVRSVSSTSTTSPTTSPLTR